MPVPAVPIQLMVETKSHRADLHINGDITKGFKLWGRTFKSEDDVSYTDVAEALKDLPDEVTEIGVHINSYGGEVAEGVAIYNALRSHTAKVTTVCEGFACSVASVIFMAGDERVMRDSSLLMLHNASMPAVGDANAHRKAADDLDVITELSKTAYLNHAKGDLTREKLNEIMDAETWVTPEQALEWGLATEIDKPADTDEPSQSAASLVAQSLTGTMATVETFDLSEALGDGLKPVLARLDELEQLITAAPNGQNRARPVQSEPQPISARLSAMFKQLGEAQ